MAKESTKQSWQTEVRELLARAARLSVDHDVDIEPFVQGATSAYFDARPGLREYLEEKQLEAALEQMRQAGRIATA